MAESSCEEECPGGAAAAVGVAVSVAGARGQAVGVVTAKGVAAGVAGAWGQAGGVAVSLRAVTRGDCC